jgi:hypothetical protein
VEQSIRDSFDPFSKITVERLTQQAKHFSPMLSTPDGTKIDESDEHQKNAHPLICLSSDALSNVTAERPPHPAKHFCPIHSTLEGMQIDDSDEQISKECAAIWESSEPTSNENV